MIEIYTGTPGSGKSLHCAETIKKWLNLYGDPVICNFEFRADLCRMKKKAIYVKVDNEKLNPEFLLWFSEYYRDKNKLERVPEEKILLVIDECQLIFNCREWNKKGRAEWLSFFTQHRKLGYRVILICQFKEMIDKQIRAVVEYEYLHRKVKNMGIYGKVMNLILWGNLHVAVKYYVPINQRVGSTFFKADKSIYFLYDSYTRFTASDPQGAGSGNRSAVSGRGVAGSGALRIGSGETV